MQSSSISSDFTNKLLNFENASPAKNEIASSMDTTIHHEEPSSQTTSLYIVPITVILKITSVFITTIPPPLPLLNPLSQQATPTPTQTASEVTTLFPTLPDFSSVFKFNDGVTNLESDMSEMKQFNRYAQAISFILAILDHYIDNKLGAAIQQAIKSHTTECREEALAEKKEYIDLIDTNQDEKYKDQDPFAGLDRGTKIKKSSMEAESSRDPRSMESTNDEQPDDEAALKVDCDTARAAKPPTSFDELMDTPIDFFAFVMNQLNIKNLTQYLLVGPTFNLLKGTCKSRTELEYHFEECFKVTTE
nr:hypothetical protein [Tanacetum cinerariifolium]